MYTKLTMAGLLASANAFQAPMMPRVQMPVAGVRMMADAPEKAEEATEEAAPPAPPPPPAVEYSEALPFLTRRASLGPKGALVGDVGFDPLGFTEIFPLVRAAASLPPAARVAHALSPLARGRGARSGGG